MVQKGVGDYTSICISCSHFDWYHGHGCLATFMYGLTFSTGASVYHAATNLSVNVIFCANTDVCCMSHGDWCVEWKGAFLNSLQFYRSFSEGRTLKYADWRGTRNTVCWMPETEFSLDTVSIAMADNLQGHGYCYNRDTDAFRRRKQDKYWVLVPRETANSVAGPSR